MATRWCVLCGSEYVEGVLECVECVVPLADERPAPVDSVGEADEEQLVYELDELEAQERYAVDRLLAQEGVVHAWDGATLVVRSADEQAVDVLLDGVVPGSLADGNEVVYELSDWTDDNRETVASALRRAGIVHEWDQNGDLSVLEADEERAEAILDAVEFPEQLPIDDGQSEGAEGGDVDGLAAQDAMSELFVAADRLMHDPADHEGVLSLVDAARLAESLPLPYGFSPAAWTALVDQAKFLRRILEGDADDGAVMDAARDLRQSLRQYV